MDKLAPTQTLRGPFGLLLQLDADQIYPDDPGQGTPILFERGRETMTWACGYEGGNLGELFPEEANAKSPKIEQALAWAESIADAVTEWETHWNAIKG